MPYNRDDDAVMTPELFVGSYLAARNITMQEAGISPIVVMSWSAGPIHWFAKKTGARRIKTWLISSTYPVFQTEINNSAVTFIQTGMGAPATAAAMEEMIACGARTFIGIGWAGSIRKDMPVGTVLLPVECVVEEGTSAHYIKDRGLIRPDKELANIIKNKGASLGLQIVPGMQWTTDAPYRELNTKIAYYRDRGVSAVDMETSAMYAVGVFRGVSVCNVLIVSDELWDQWNPGFAGPALNTSFMKAKEAVLAAVEHITSTGSNKEHSPVE